MIAVDMAYDQDDYCMDSLSLYDGYGADARFIMGMCETLYNAPIEMILLQELYINFTSYDRTSDTGFLMLLSASSETGTHTH